LYGDEPALCAVASVINFAIRGRRPEADRIDPDIN
jgi:hypothetical protein